MRQANLTTVALGGLLLAAGCDRDQTSGTSPAPTPPSSSGAAAPVVSPATSPSATADDMASDARAAGSSAAAGARSAVGEAAGEARDLSVRAGDAATSAQTQPAAAAQMTTEQAKTMLDQAVTYVKQNKYDLAEKSLNQVEAHKASLPKVMQDQIGTVRTMLTTAKAGGGLQIPGLGGNSTAK